MNFLKQSTSVTVLIGPFVDSSDGNTVEGSLTIAQADVRLSKNGGNMAQKNEATSCTHDELGYYTCPLDTTDTGTLGILKLMVHESGALPVWHEFLVVTANVYDTLCSTDQLDVNVTNIEGSDATDQINAACDASIETYHLDHLLAADYDPSSKPGVATALLNELVENDGGVSRFTENALEQAPSGTGASAATIADAVWDEAQADHVAAGSFGLIASEIATIDGIVDDILADTNELQTDDIPGSLTTIDGKIDTIDGIVDNILVDTGTTLDGKLDTIDTNVDAILVDTGTTLDGKLDTIDGNVDSILADTNELQSDDIPGTLTTIEGKIDTVDGNVDSILTDTGTTLPASISGLNDLSAAEVNAQVVDALNTDTYAEPGQGDPPATATLVQKIGYLYKAWRNKKTETATATNLYNDAGDTIDQTRTVSDDSTTATVGEFGTGA